MSADIFLKFHWKDSKRFQNNNNNLSDRETYKTDIPCQQTVPSSDQFLKPPTADPLIKANAFEAPLWCYWSQLAANTVQCRHLVGRLIILVCTVHLQCVHYPYVGDQFFTLVCTVGALSNGLLLNCLSSQNGLFVLCGYISPPKIINKWRWLTLLFDILIHWSDQPFFMFSNVEFICTCPLHISHVLWFKFWPYHDCRKSNFAQSIIITNIVCCAHHILCVFSANAFLSLHRTLGYPISKYFIRH